MPSVMYLIKNTANIETNAAEPCVVKKNDGAMNSRTAQNKRTTSGAADCLSDNCHISSDSSHSTSDTNSQCNAH